MPKIDPKKIKLDAEKKPNLKAVALPPVEKKKGFNAIDPKKIKGL